MMLGRASTPVGRAAAEKLTADTISPDSSDSGYGTGNTTDGSTTDHSQDLAEGVALPSRRFFERKVTKLRLFNDEIPQLTQHRFHDLQELFERPLCDYLINAKVKANPISIKLKVLGESEATAKPWIVVLCNKTASKKIRQFFNQQQIKADYQPFNPDSSLPSFEVFVCNRPPRPMAGTEIYGDYEERATMCGRTIKVGEAHQARFATLGGVVMVVKPPGITMLYGMTAGHILAQQPLGQDNFDQVDFCDEPEEEDEEDEGFYSGEEEYELDDDAFEGEEEVRDMATTGDRTRNISQSTKLGHLWPKIGFVSAASSEGTTMGHDLDWALIDFDKSADYRPNLLVLLDGKGGAARNCPLTENAKLTEDGSSRSVFLVSGTGGLKSGSLSTSLSFLMMGPTKAFTKTYTVVLPHGSVLNAGDCGSWVVDPSTFEVYGHVVASDAMGDTYVVPLDATLRDMERKLEAAVSLPTEADIHTWLAQNNKSTGEHVTTPNSSKKRQVAFKDSNMDRAKSQRDRQKLARHSQAVTSSAPSAIGTTTPVVDYCNSCHTRFEGTSQDIKSNLLRHLRTCSRQNKDTATRNESSLSQDAKDTSDEWSKSSSVKSSKDVQQKTTDPTSTQQTSSVPQSIRSMFSNFRKKSSRNSQQKDRNKGKSISSSKDNKPSGSGSSRKPAATASPNSTAKTLKNDTKKSKSGKTSSTPPISTGLPAPSLALADRISGDLPLAPPAPRAVLDHRVTPSSVTPVSSRMRQSERILPSPPRTAPSHRNPNQISYEGYTFTKCKSMKDTWAVSKIVPMPVSQDDLKDEIKRNRKKHISALDEYYDKKMRGFKRQQVDNLIRERTKIDGDYGYEYVLASIKLDSRKIKGKLPETVSMQVILKRQMTAGILHDPLTGSSMDFHATLPSQVIDLTNGDEPEMAKDYGGGNQGHQGPVVSFAGHPEGGAFPLSSAHDQFSRPGVQHVDERPLFLLDPTPLPFELPHSPAQDMRLPPRPYSAPLALVHEENWNTQGHFQKVSKPKDRKKKMSKEKAATTADISNKTRKKHDSISKSPSLSDLSSDSKSDHSWAKTDATPDTVVSGESREYRKEKTSHKESKESFHNKDNIERTPYASGIEQPVWREHKRKEHRRSSLSPARKSRDVSPGDLELDLERHRRRAPSLRYSYGTRYHDHGQFDIEPAISFPTHRSPRHRRSSVSPERTSHRRASSYDPDRSLAHSYRDLVAMHLRPDLYGHEVELAREQQEWERRRLQREREEYEDRTRGVGIWQMDSHERERERRDAERDARTERMRDGERRGRVIIERHGSRRGTIYDDSYMPRHPRDPDHYY